MDGASNRRGRMKIGITCYPTGGGSGAVATGLGIELIVPMSPTHDRAVIEGTQ